MKETVGLSNFRINLSVFFRCWHSQKLHKTKWIENLILKNVVNKAENIDELSRFSNPVLCDNPEGWNRAGGGSKVQEGGDICQPMADSC